MESKETMTRKEVVEAVGKAARELGKRIPKELCYWNCGCGKINFYEAEECGGCCARREMDKGSEYPERAEAWDEEKVRRWWEWNRRLKARHEDPIDGCQWADGKVGRGFQQAVNLLGEEGIP